MPGKILVVDDEKDMLPAKFALGGKDPAHKLCGGCHTEKKAGPAANKCMDCHKVKK